MFEKINCPANVKKILSGQISTEKTANAYIFAGPDREIKYDTAVQFAKILNCSSDGAEICGRCAGCLTDKATILLCDRTPSCNITQPPCRECIRTDGKSNPDILAITSDKSVGINPIHELIRFMNLKSARGGFKTGIVVNAEIMTMEAANSLLKILEEPPSDSCIILLTSAIYALLPTIRSRSQILRFPPVKDNYKVPDYDREFVRNIVELKKNGRYAELFKNLSSFYKVSAVKNKTAAALRREKTLGLIEAMFLDSAALMREKPGERLAGEIEYLHECRQMLLRQRMPQVVLNRLIFKGMPSFL